ncbi:ABC transporter permease [Spelaeicoccus albus]|uniref:NitT/TauT family transport system permease protein n=1 Tax=Spelaeicoccus albus TaxID=1280376 RepID=A0A7Z0AC00_9MICO|nr:ABC transporter permease [Spelaeicoccus albus]NYI67070.1 NitT/TauT family transport system permease protein [Spelaeicoccus albus]
MTATIAPTDESSAKTRRPRSNKFSTISVVSVFVGLGLWWLASILNPTTLSSPLDVAKRLVELAGDGTLFTNIAASLGRVFAGFAIGTVLAIIVGFGMGWYLGVRAAIQPWIQFFRVIPPLAIIPLAIVLMGIGETPKIFVITLASFLVSVIATYQGVISVDKTLINAGRVLGTNDLTIFLKIVVPASVPFILVGMRQGLGAAWATLVAAELIAAQDGLGHMMQKAQTYYDLDTIFVGLIVIGILGLLMDRILLWAEKRLTQWQERR